ncbi:hypothetical protein [Gimesia algae]|uniref:Uncharacterized protein n=1 Tax=Gimesia algae TaxID=2527971 RepID=A0A517VHJ3_9PLAN|nr:hypothetical protein [Gimesia algae]QDT92486.1 hypothetical protein Pan161_41530 [Gimesia algae]
MLKKSNQETHSIFKNRRFRQGLFDQQNQMPYEPLKGIPNTELQPCVEDRESSQAESSMITRLILIMLLMGITPFLLLLLALLLVPDLLHIEITP